ncbi:MAG: T9SS type A sorting domain-containing protein [Lewinellaceae bacterium]|nr:T9SS type A sorting domain-containing protein [Lewinellaceae bacterium]
MKNIAFALFFLLALTTANAAIYTVVNTNDSGPGSLRWAIIQANSGPNPNIINFNIPGAGPYEINLQSPLPIINFEVDIYGYSQPGSFPASGSNPAGIKIALNGTAAGTGASGLNMSGNSCYINGLAIYGFETGIMAGGNNNVVEGCHIGLDATGMNPVGNAVDGIIITGQQNRIGGADASARNVIAGHSRSIAIFPYAPANRIEGNYIGTNATGNATIPGNGFDGIAVSSDNNTIVNNVIVGYSSNNILITLWAAGFPYPEGNIIQGNRVGHHADGSFSSFVNNCQGVSLNNGRNTTITENVIFGNGCQGVLISGGAATGNLVSNNSIYGNAGLAINLGLDGVTPNDPGDADLGPNRLQNFPVLESAKANASKTKVKGFIDTSNPATVTVEFYANSAPNASGHGDGETLIGTASPKSNGKVKTNLPPVAPGTYLSAIAIDSENNTSEFSLSIAVTGPGGGLGRPFPGDPQVAASGKGNAAIPKASVFPNPFSGQATIAYHLPEGRPVQLSIFSSNGQLLRVLQDGFQAAGNHQMRFNSRGLAAGVYYYRLIAGEEVHGGKMVLKP